jgi:hypothetical protein
LPELIKHFFFCWHFPIPIYFPVQENILFQENYQAKYLVITPKTGPALGVNFSCIKKVEQKKCLIDDIGSAAIMYLLSPGGELLAYHLVVSCIEDQIRFTANAIHRLMIIFTKY